MIKMNIVRLIKVRKGVLRITVKRNPFNSLVISTYTLELDDGMWSISGRGYCYSASRLRDVLLFACYRDKWI